MSTNNGISTIHDTATNKDVPFSRRFPADIESMIFEEACYNERIVWIRESRFKVAIDSGYLDLRSLSRFRSNQPVPAIMHVNANAREIALRHYKAGFAAQKDFNKLDLPEIENHRIYLNPTSDIVWPVNSMSSHFVKSLRDLNVETIAIDIFPTLNILRGELAATHSRQVRKNHDKGNEGTRHRGYLNAQNGFSKDQATGRDPGTSSCFIGVRTSREFG
ncbi:uncharacterized protein EAF02_005138 [Botrytis sinoallii]|uniref:uncharacterized protein n=1 Tax=Botrytis sinoallii TaxID=1463999 RepID=UPI0018FF1356|nr:uncharacterized protein EAF02_005138 [Botrytis sinoallii]KAF7883218.1 hypothetical protein EAF02_005138 [Botrytis sinoallii]